MKLSNLAQGRDNNFNLIRIVAALAVLVTHSFALAIGTSAAEPFRESLGTNLGAIAVDIFFVTSGFLVTASLLTRQSAIEFAWARVLRIYPALLLMVSLTVFGLGAFFTTLPLLAYLTDAKTYAYFLKCATLITGITYTLPGVFGGNPYRNTVNGSLWTMPHEIAMYAILAVVWVSLRVTKSSRLRLFQVSIVASFVLAGILVVVRHFYLPAESQFGQLFFMFFCGAAVYVLREYITVSRELFGLAVLALLSSAIVNAHAFFVVYVITIGYILFYVAYVPSGFIRRYNGIGDYSYGIYIYAFPIQQSVAALIPGISVLSMLLISAPATILFAAVSWHLIERRALNLKRLYVGRTRRALPYDVPDVSTQTR